mmetsp:Transcript_110905/g.320540  ORF Transcript_110905/g.320540 Transcript_110905/m.320540 type:complete len:500 (-) Transcript_110905:90-1589(-)
MATSVGSTPMASYRTRKAPQEPLVETSTTKLGASPVPTPQQHAVRRPTFLRTARPASHQQVKSVAGAPSFAWTQAPIAVRRPAAAAGSTPVVRTATSATAESEDATTGPSRPGEGRSETAKPMTGGSPQPPPQRNVSALSPKLGTPLSAPRFVGASPRTAQVRRTIPLASAAANVSPAAPPDLSPGPVAPRSSPPTSLRTLAAAAALPASARPAVRPAALGHNQQPSAAGAAVVFAPGATVSQRLSAPHGAVSIKAAVTRHYSTPPPSLPATPLQVHRSPFSGAACADGNGATRSAVATACGPPVGTAPTEEASQCAACTPTTTGSTTTPETHMSCNDSLASLSSEKLTPEGQCSATVGGWAADSAPRFGEVGSPAQDFDERPRCRTIPEATYSSAAGEATKWQSAAADGAAGVEEVTPPSSCQHTPGMAAGGGKNAIVWGDAVEAAADGENVGCEAAAEPGAAEQDGYSPYAFAEQLRALQAWLQQRPVDAKAVLVTA